MIAPEAAFVRAARTPAAAPSEPVDPTAKRDDDTRGGEPDFALLLEDGEDPDATATPPALPAVSLAVPTLPIPVLPLVQPPVPPPVPPPAPTSADKALSVEAVATAPTPAAPPAAPPTAPAAAPADPAAAPATATAEGETLAPTEAKGEKPAPLLRPAGETPAAVTGLQAPPTPAKAPPPVAPPAAREARAAAPEAPAVAADPARPEGPSTTPARPPAAADAPGPTLTPTDAPPSWSLVREAGHAHAQHPAHRAEAPVAPSAPAIVHQVSVAVAASDQGSVEIRLDPPELGRVQIHLTPLDGGGVQATVLADRPETGDLLRRHAAQLARELGEAGYGEVSLDFAAGGEAPRDGAPRPDASGIPAAPEAWTAPLAAAPVASPTVVRTAPAADRLDIRL